MAYEVTATRRRPQKFDDLIGQDFVASTLKNSIANGQIAHAYLFSGPRGCGKTSTARILAKVLNCEAGVENAPCGHCTACQEIARGASLDVIEIDGASNNSIDNIRQIKDEVLFPPNSGKYKIYIIDEVHMLSKAAFNALLKTIEEPPPYVIFIFATTELHMVPATIKSRCQQFHFKLGSMDQIKNLLAASAAEMGIQADEEALYWIARESTGSFRDAYTLFDQVAAFSGSHITYEGIRDKLGLVGVERLNELCEACAEGNAQKALEFLDSLIQNGISIEQTITNMADYLRSLLFIQSGVTREVLLGQSVERYSKTVLEKWDAVRLERALSLFLQLYRDIRYSLSPRTELEVAISRLCWLSSYVSAAEVKQAIDSARGLLAGAPASPAAINSTIPPASSAPQPTFGGNQGMSNRWQQMQQPQSGQMQQSLSNQPQQFTGQQSAGFGHTQQPVHRQPGMPVFSALREGPGGTPQGMPPSGAAGDASHPFQDSCSAPNGNHASSAAAPSAPSGTPPALSLEQVRTQVIDQLRVSKMMLSSSLAESKPWRIEGNLVSIPVGSQFLQKQIEAEIRTIAGQIASIWGKPVQLSVLFEKEVEVKQEEQLPENVAAICALFNGKVTGMTAATAQTPADTTTGSSDDTDDDGDTYIDTTDPSLDEGDDDEL